MVYKKIREKRLRMSVVVLNSEHKAMSMWLRQNNTCWQQWLHSHVIDKCQEIEVEKQMVRNQKLLAKQEQLEKEFS